MLRRFFQFVFALFFGILTEISVDFLRCVARGIWIGDISPRLKDLPGLVGGICVFVLILILSVIGPEWLVRPEKKVVGGEKTVSPPEKVTAGDRAVLILAFIVAICITGIRYLSLCEKPTDRSTPISAIMK